MSLEITPKIEFLGLTFDLTVMIGTVVTMILVLLFCILSTRKLALRPRGMQNVMEMVIEFIRGITRIMLDNKRAEKYMSFALTTFLFVFISNQLGVITMISAKVEEPIASLGLTAEALQSVDGVVNWFKSPTSNINVTVALAFAIAIYAHVLGISKSPKAYLKHYVQPFWPMAFIHIIDEFAKPTTHAARLWANIFAGEVLILILREGAMYWSWLPLIPWLGFSVFVGTIQAYIFAVLAMVYIAQKETVADH